jgi:hypothetical protein
MMTRLFLLAATALFVPAAAFAQDAAPATTAVAPAATTPSAPALCTDRPTKATSACTVPQGKVQFESDIVNWTRTSDSGVRTDVTLYSSPALKYGLTSSTDVEASITPYETIVTRDATGKSKISGVGDLYLRVKQRLTASDAKAQFAIIPYVKIPTAKLGIGNRKVEGGVVGTGVFTLPDGFSLTVTPEVDALLDSDGHGHHAQFGGALNVSKTLSSKLTASAELWTAQNQDPAGHVRQYSADFALAYLAGPTLQLDAGTNIGLNRATPDVQAYAGISTRF